MTTFVFQVQGTRQAEACQHKCKPLQCQNDVWSGHWTGTIDRMETASCTSDSSTMRFLCQFPFPSSHFSSALGEQQQQQTTEEKKPAMGWTSDTACVRRVLRSPVKEDVDWHVQHNIKLDTRQHGTGSSSFFLSLFLDVPQPISMSLRWTVPSWCERDRITAPSGATNLRARSWGFVVQTACAASYQDQRTFF